MSGVYYIYAESHHNQLLAHLHHFTKTPHTPRAATCWSHPSHRLSAINLFSVPGDLACQAVDVLLWQTSFSCVFRVLYVTTPSSFLPIAKCISFYRHTIFYLPVDGHKLLPHFAYHKRCGWEQSCARSSVQALFSQGPMAAPCSSIQRPGPLLASQPWDAGVALHPWQHLYFSAVWVSPSSQVCGISPWVRCALPW